MRFGIRALLVFRLSAARGDASRVSAILRMVTTQ